MCTDCEVIRRRIRIYQRHVAYLERRVARRSPATVDADTRNEIEQDEHAIVELTALLKRRGAQCRTS